MGRDFYMNPPDERQRKARDTAAVSLADKCLKFFDQLDKEGAVTAPLTAGIRLLVDEYKQAKKELRAVR